MALTHNMALAHQGNTDTSSWAVAIWRSLTQVTQTLVRGQWQYGLALTHPGNRANVFGTHIGNWGTSSGEVPTGYTDPHYLKFLFFAVLVQLQG